MLPSRSCRDGLKQSVKRCTLGSVEKGPLLRIAAMRMHDRDFIGIYRDFIGICRDFVGINGDFIGINRDLIGI